MERNKILKIKKKQSKNQNKNYFEILVKILLLILFSTIYLFLLKPKNPSGYQEGDTMVLKSSNKVPSTKPNRKDFIFITCMFGKERINSDDGLRRYFYTINKFIPNSKIVLAVSEYTFVEPKLIDFENITIIIERFGNVTKEEVKNKYNYKLSTYTYFSGLKPQFYAYYLKAHPEIKYCAISDDDTLFIKDPFELISNNSSEVHIMEDVLPFSEINNWNYKWTNAYVNLDKFT